MKQSAPTTPDANGPVDTQERQSPAMISAEPDPGRADLKLLVFDMGHVFVDFDWDTVCAGFRSKSGCSREDLRAAFIELAKLGYESGRVDTAGFLAELNARLGTNIDREEFTVLWTSSFHENEEMAALLQRLKQQRPLYLLSNTNEVHFTWLQTKYDVSRHFQELILSYLVGSSKPEALIYQEVLKRSGFAPEHCLFVDDLEPNIKAASRLGMHTIHFRGVQDLKDRLSSYGLEV